MENLWDYIAIWNYPGVQLIALGMVIYFISLLCLARNPKKLRKFLDDFIAANQPKEGGKK